MTTAHTSTAIPAGQPSAGDARREAFRPPATAGRPSQLVLGWAVSPQALGRAGDGPLALELHLAVGRPATLRLDGRPFEADPAASAALRLWLDRWDGRLSAQAVCDGPASGMLIVQARPIAEAVLQGPGPGRPLHLRCDLPALLGLQGGRYEPTNALVHFARPMPTTP